MARDVEFDVTSNDKTSPGLTKAEENFRRSQERQTRILEREQKKQEAAVKKTQAEQERFRKKAEADQDKQNASIRSSLGVFTSLIQGVAPKFAASLAKTLAGAGDALGPVLAGAAVAAAPFIGATISAAVIGGAGIGGVVGGVLLAARNPQVQAAGKQLGANLLNSLESRAGVFVGPVLSAITLIEKRFDEVGGSVSKIFANSAKFVAPLVDGITRALQSVTRGLANITGGAGPVIAAIADGIAGLGDAIGRMLTSLAKDGPAAAEALRLSFLAVEAVIGELAFSLSVLTKSFGFLAQVGAFGPKIQQQYLIAKVAADAESQANTQVASSLGAVSTVTAGFAASVRLAAGAVNQLTTANRALFGSDADVTLGLRDANAAIKDNIKHSKNKKITDAENNKVLETLAGTLQTNYENFLKLNPSISQAGLRGDNLRASFIKAATATGLNAAAAERLANRILGIPKSHKTSTEIATAKAEAAAKRVRAAIENIPTHWRTTVDIATHVTGSSASSSAIAAALRKNFDLSARWGAADGGGSSRTGGPTPVNVNSSVTSNVFLDGRPFRAMTVQAVADSERRQQYKARVGAR